MQFLNVGSCFSNVSTFVCGCVCVWGGGYECLCMCVYVCECACVCVVWRIDRGRQRKPEKREKKIS